MTSSFMTMTNNWTIWRRNGTIWRRNGIAVDTLDFFENSLSKSTKLGQCIQTSEVSRNLTSNFSAVSCFCFQLLLKKGHEAKTNKGQADQFPYVTPSWALNALNAPDRDLRRARDGSTYAPKWLADQETLISPSPLWLHLSLRRDGRD